MSAALCTRHTCLVRHVQAPYEGSGQMHGNIKVKGALESESPVSVTAVCALMNKPGVGNFNFYLIGIGISSSARGHMETLCRARHAHYIDCGGDYNIIRKVYREVRDLGSFSSLWHCHPCIDALQVSAFNCLSSSGQARAAALAASRTTLALLATCLMYLRRTCISALTHRVMACMQQRRQCW